MIFLQWHFFDLLPMLACTHHFPKGVYSDTQKSVTSQKWYALIMPFCTYFYILIDYRSFYKVTLFWNPFLRSVTPPFVEIKTGEGISVWINQFRIQRTNNHFFYLQQLLRRFSFTCDGVRIPVKHGTETARSYSVNLTE